MLATGRSWEGTRGIQHVLELAPEYAVCSNGAVIMKRVGGDFAEEGRYERFHVETFDPSEVVELLRAHLPHAKYMVELADGERLYTERLDDWNLAHARRVDFAELVAQPVCRVVVVSPDETDEDFLALVERIGLNKVSYAVGWSAWLDIAPQGVDKSTALERVRTWLGVEPDRVLVMGDGRNDLGCSAGRSITAAVPSRWDRGPTRCAAKRERSRLRCTPAASPTSCANSDAFSAAAQDDAR
jgi:hydroxymethylpyrimidine pyrophosphatase-like HAD family hydrolase